MFTGQIVPTATSETREFLARALAWPQEGEEANFVNIHYLVRLKNKDGSPKMVDGKQAIAVPGRACRNVDEATRAIEWANSLNTDVYICMSAQREAEEKISKRNFKYLKAIRRLDNATRYKSIFADIDVKPDDLKHGYVSPEEAVTEFVRIRTELGLPRQTFVVKSGSGGFHAHWCFAEPITTDRWRALSSTLAAAFIAKGFRGDTQCIVDGVRLLRPPGTFNFKKKEAPQRVTLWGNTDIDYAVEALETSLAPYVGMMRAPVPAKANGHFNGSLGPMASVFGDANYDKAIPSLNSGLDVLLPTIEDVAKACPFILRTLATGGSDNSNPLWLQTVNLALFTQGARDVAHRLSQGHATYSVEATDALVDRQEVTKRTRDLGWPRCDTISSYGAPECNACPLRVRSKSPLNFARAAAGASAAPVGGVPAQPQGITSTTPAPSLIGLATSGGAPQPPSASASALAPLPSIYQYDQLGRVCIIITDENGAQTMSPLCGFVMEKPWLQQTPPSLNFTTYTSQGVQAQIKVPFEVINDSTAFKRTLGRQGMVPYKHELDDLGEFYVAWIDKLRSDRTNVVQNQSFGWAVKNGKIEGFVYGGYMWSKDVPRPAANADPVLSSQYNPVGDLQPWLDAAKLITNQNRPALDAILAAAFAAPLVRFTGQAGVLLSTYSTQSGIGKSTALKIAQSVWGNPIKAVQSLSDTQNSVLKKMGDTKNLPLFWDELKTKDDTQKFANLAFQLSLGKEKSRLAADTSYREPGTWQTLLCSTSNDSLLAYVMSQTKTTAAGIYRVFEYEVPRGVTGQISPNDAALIVGALNDNYGAAGLLYSQFLGTQHERVAKDVAAYGRTIEEHCKVQADERFWLALVVTVVMGAVYANELGLTSINVDALTRFMIEKLQTMRNERTVSTVDIHIDTNVLGILSRYINEHRQSHTLTTNVIWRQAGRPGVGQLQMKGSWDKVRSVRIHIGDDDHFVRLIKTPWDDWLVEKGLTPALINKQLVEQFGVAQSRGRLGGGTMMVTASEVMFEFNSQDPKFLGMLDV